MIVYTCQGSPQNNDNRVVLITKIKGILLHSLYHIKGKGLNSLRKH